MEKNVVVGLDAYHNWPNVNIHFTFGPLNGTLFLVSSASHNASIQWIPDKAEVTESINTRLDIALSDVNSIERKVHNFGRSYSILYITSRSGSHYGPFEFTCGGSRRFISSLKSYVNLKLPFKNRQLYVVQRNQEDYNLPPLSNDGVGKMPFQKFQLVGKKILESIRPPPSSDQLLDQVRCTPDDTDQQVPISPPDQRQDFIQTGEDNDFQIISPSLGFLSPSVPRQKALTRTLWLDHLDAEGRVAKIDNLKNSIYLGGVESEIRPTVWKYLLGYMEWKNTEAENNFLLKKKHIEYHEMKSFWKNMSPERKKYYKVFQDRTEIIEKDVFRTDRQTEYFRDNTRGYLERLYDILVTYTFYNIDFGYLQGMNDVLAIILIVIDVEEDAFWCFVNLMNSSIETFHSSDSYTKQTFAILFKICEILMPSFADFLRIKDSVSMNFCYRWLLIHFKREFCYDDVKILWEVLWCAPKNFYLLIAASILYGEMSEIMSTCEDGNQILQYVNNLKGRIDILSTISRAQEFYRHLLGVKSTLPNEVAVSLGFRMSPVSTDIHDYGHEYSTFLNSSAEPSISELTIDDHSESPSVNPPNWQQQYSRLEPDPFHKKALPD